VTGPIVGAGGNGPTIPTTPAPAPPSGTVSQVIDLDATHFAGTVLSVAATQQRTAGLLVGGKVQTLSWTAGQAPALDQVKSLVYQARTTFTSIEQLLHIPLTAVDLSVDLPHEYYYAIPLGLAQCY